MFSHSLPEPAGLALATLCLGVAISRRGGSKSRIKAI
jgi:hypothetical protein